MLFSYLLLAMIVVDKFAFITISYIVYYEYFYTLLILLFIFYIDIVKNDTDFVFILKNLSKKFKYFTILTKRFIFKFLQRIKYKNLYSKW